jgi:murein DD-endopeptidase MepM/ murein hydrolase activator NlpD
MSKEKYKYNPITLEYEKVETTWKTHAWRIGSYLATGITFATIVILLAYSPIKKHVLKEEVKKSEHSKDQIVALDRDIEELTRVMDYLEKKDDDVYRVIFEAEPFPEYKRRGGTGGAVKYKELKGDRYEKLLVSTRKKLDKLARRMVGQSESFEEVMKLAKAKEKMLASTPAILPISDNDLTRVSSGYGYRMDPVYKTRKMHWGMDFTAPTGTEIYASGDGIVEKAEWTGGYGQTVLINHGFGYKSQYAHMNAYNVKKGQKVKRGDVVGFVGSTGKSTAPHLHYEILHNGKKINPVNYYFNDLSPLMYEKMLEISRSANQSFD